MTVGTDFAELLVEFRDAPSSAWDDLVTELQRYSVDELRVLGAVHERLTVGRAHYGGLSLAGDGRDWLRELWEEQADAVIYILIASLVANPAGRRSAAPEQRSTLRVVRPDDVDPPGRGAPR